MRPLTLFVALLSVTFIGGCKIRMVASEGGSIGTQSGHFSCAAGASCAEIDVSDTDFDQTFTGIPEAGFTFAGWLSRNRSLCGGNSGTCRIFTAGFTGNDLLLSFLDKDDEVFFLEAVFFQDQISGSGTGSADQCFNAAQFQPDSTVTASYRDNSVGDVSISGYDRVVTAGATFNGKSTLKATSNIVIEADGDNSSGTVESFILPRNTQKRLLEFGNIVTIVQPEQITVTLTVRPSRLYRFDLAAGESYVQEYEETIETSFPGFNDTEQATVRVITTFKGIESVTVPAGTFQACKFVEQLTDGPFATTTTEWFGVGNGLLLKSVDDNETSELVSATINGASI